MFEQLKMLLNLRAWYKSTALKAGGFAGFMGALQVYLSSQQGIDLVAMLASVLHLMPATLGGALMALVGVVIWLLRAKAEWSLTEQTSGVADPPSQPPK